MYKAFILLGIFIVIVYVYTYIKIKKNKEKTNKINSIRDFHESYGHLINNQKDIAANKTSQYNNYVTKYNSSEDYREKR